MNPVNETSFLSVNALTVCFFNSLGNLLVQHSVLISRDADSRHTRVRRASS
jgi:hypothetical protein